VKRSKNDHAGGEEEATKRTPEKKRRRSLSRQKHAIPL
jgi:hypothetical protein